MAAAEIEDELPIRRRATLVYRLARFIGIPLVNIIFKIQISGRELIPATAAFVIVANHLNWLDSFLILLTFPAEPRVHFLADPELLRKRRLQWWIVRHAAGYIAVDRHVHPDPAMFDRVQRCLAIGGVVAIYPEGNYGPAEAQLLPFKKGFAHFALRAQVPVVPVALSGTQRLWLRKRVAVVIGEPFDAAEHDVDTLTALGETRLRAILPPYREAAGPKPLERFLTHLF